MRLDDVEISRAIVRRYMEKLESCLESEAIIVGGGPAGLAAAYYLARAGRQVLLLERKLSVGGGMWGGGMMFNEIVVQDEGKAILDEFGIATKPWKKGYHTADSVECVSTICSMACKAGARILNLIGVEDVLLRGDGVAGLVVLWSATEIAKLHVDPISMRSKFVIDATGHAAEIASIIERKIGPRLLTPSGRIEGEKPMLADEGERMILENTKEFYPGVFAAGMACNAIFGAPRMGPIFGGMLMSGRKAASLLIERL